MDLFMITANLKNHFPVVQESVTLHTQRAAVLVITFNKNSKAHILMTKRALHLKIHAGEISFPGGVMEPDDQHLMDTALRETVEEIGLEVDTSQVIGCLPKVLTRTGFEITPYVAILQSLPNLTISEDEVDEVLEIPLTALLSTHQRDVGYKPDEKMVVYWYECHRVWGASAKILRQIENLIGV
jgi:8-oxo-dGTP pyrophosphatase MutT (NUDIX family)